MVNEKCCVTTLGSLGREFKKQRRRRRGQRGLKNERTILSFHVVVLQGTAKKCTNNYNARAQSLFCSFSGFTQELVSAI